MTTDLRELLAEELAIHHDLMTDIHNGTARTGCTCGWDNGVHTATELAATIRGQVTEYRLHVADSIIAALRLDAS